TFAGGANGDGVLFEFDLQTDTYTVKVDFEEVSKGDTPTGSLSQATNGKLYGTTLEGGINDMGVLFEYDPATNVFAKLVDFNGVNNGALPYESVFQASNGKLYGMTLEGGTNNFGVIYKYDLVTQNLTKEIDFDGFGNGASPSGKLLQASNDKLYGMTSSGGTNNFGVLFEYDFATSTYTKKLDFNGIMYGANPPGSLIEISDGMLYGMTITGGVEDKGILFKYDPGDETFTKLLDFYGLDFGENPYGSLVEATNGKLFGTTRSGGEMDKGILFEYDPVNGIFLKKFDFLRSPEGSTPYGSLLQASNGKVYGLTSEGGDNHSGTIFEYDPVAKTYSVIYDFDWYNTGGSPRGSLIQASNGNLYGMTNYGTASSYGALFGYDPVTNTYTKLHDFDGINYGSNPYGNLLQASNNKLYGLTYHGGINDDGVLFEFDLNTNTFTKMFDFQESNYGSWPMGNLTEAANGKLYGMTYRGGSFNKGVLFEYDPVTYNYAVKINFDETNMGSHPRGSLIQVGDNKLYGLTSSGGVNSSGVLFIFDAGNASYTKLLNFDGENYGAGPQGTLMLASNNKLYGMTSWGGIYGYGVIFEYDQTSGVFSKIFDFSDYKNHPGSGYLTEIMNTGDITEFGQELVEMHIFPNPVENIFTLEVSGMDKEIEVFIYDLSGRLLFEDKMVNLNNDQLRKQYNITYLSKGIYTIRLTDHKKVAVSKIVIQ
ncbi:MAG: T9SS type A sorting domain-containing protein, partial [Bacteroidales bacterium]|nr:T9SS type A sorting domain-containing protein [Bacteroidales bacterium]